MAENRRFYYLKLKENFYINETMVVLESMPDGFLYSNLLLKMYLMSLKSGGTLMLNEHLPHTVQTIATFTRHHIGTVEKAIKVFMEFGLVEVLTNGAFYMTNIQTLIGKSSTEGERKRQERSRLQRQKLLPSGEMDICPPIGSVDKCPLILEIRDKEYRDKELRDKELRDKELRDKSLENKEKEYTRAVYGRYKNVFLSDEELSELEADFPIAWQEYIERLSEYMTSTGKTYKNHAATIRRWAKKDEQESGITDYSCEECESL